MICPACKRTLVWSELVVKKDHYGEVKKSIMQNRCMHGDCGYQWETEEEILEEEE